MSRRRKPAVTLPGTVARIIPASPNFNEPEKVEIAVEGADPLYQEIRVENTLKDEAGTEVGLKPGAQVVVTIEAEPQETKTKEQSSKAEPGEVENKEPESA